MSARVWCFSTVKARDSGPVIWNSYPKPGVGNVRMNPISSFEGCAVILPLDFGRHVPFLNLASSKHAVLGIVRGLSIQAPNVGKAERTIRPTMRSSSNIAQLNDLNMRHTFTAVA